MLTLRKNGFLFLLFLSLLLILPVRAARCDTRIMVITDPHYLASSLYSKDSPYFLRCIQSSDGRATQYCPELMRALVMEAREEKPDALIITGDLTFGGELPSHIEFAAYLSEIESMDIPVWVIPGNHDINTVDPVGFGDSGPYPTDNISEEDFIRIYGDFIGDISPRDGIGLSYALTVGSGMEIIMLDVSCHTPVAYTNGVFTSAHEAWMEEILSSSPSSGIRTVTASHHNLLVHSSYRTEYYTMYGGQRMTDLMEKYGVPLHLSGHLHTQHLQHQGAVTDAALEAFCLFPHSYAILTLDESAGTMTYDVKSLQEEFLPDGFSGISEKWFDQTVNAKVLSSLLSLQVPSEDVSRMLSFYDQLHKAYFQGTKKPDRTLLVSDPGYSLWKQYDPERIENILGMLGEENHRHLEISFPASP